MKQEFNQDAHDFAKYILFDWLKRVAIAADNGRYELEIVSWTSNATFNGTKINYLLDQKLLDILEQETELSAKLEKFLINKNKREITILSENDYNFTELYSEDEYKYIFLIKLTWK